MGVPTSSTSAKFAWCFGVLDVSGVYIQYQKTLRYLPKLKLLSTPYFGKRSLTTEGKLSKGVGWAAKNFAQINP
jgi:hypothetical protein